MNILFYYRNKLKGSLSSSHRVEKRSHTLRYVLKNRATGKALFVVLFTLYLKEDIDEHGNVKPGVEGGMPFDLMDGNKADRHKKAANGEDIEEDADGSGKENVPNSGGGGDFDDDGVD